MSSPTNTDTDQPAIKNLKVNGTPDSGDPKAETNSRSASPDIRASSPKGDDASDAADSAPTLPDLTDLEYVCPPLLQTAEEIKDTAESLISILKELLKWSEQGYVPESASQDSYAGFSRPRKPQSTEEAATAALEWAVSQVEDEVRGLEMLLTDLKSAFKEFDSGYGM